MAKKKKPKATKQSNPVAKHARAFNKAAVHEDRTKFKRNEKHRSKAYDAFLLTKIPLTLCRMSAIIS